MQIAKSSLNLKSVGWIEFKFESALKLLMNLNFAKSMNLNLNFDFSKSINLNLNLVFLKSMNLNLVFLKSMNLNLKIKKKMNGSNPGRDISAPKEKQPFHLRSRGASTGHQTASDANCWTICALLIAIMLGGICSPAPA